MSDCAWFKACSDADLAESELRGEINRMLGRKEYQRQVEFGISIGGATHEQRSEWGRKDTSVKLNLAMASVVQLVRSDLSGVGRSTSVKLNLAMASVVQLVHSDLSGVGRSTSARNRKVLVSVVQLTSSDLSGVGRAAKLLEPITS